MLNNGEITETFNNGLDYYTNNTTLNLIITCLLTLIILSLIVLILKQETKKY